MSLKLRRKREIPSNITNNFGKVNSLAAITSPKHSDHFSKTKSSYKPNTKGKPSEVLYRKTDKTSFKFDINFGENDYVTDGGIHKKKERFSNMNSPKHTITTTITTKKKTLVSSRSMLRVKKFTNNKLNLITSSPSDNKVLYSHQNKMCTTMRSPKHKTRLSSPVNSTYNMLSSPSNKKIGIFSSSKSSLKTKSHLKKEKEPKSNSPKVTNHLHINNEIDIKNEKMHNMYLLIERNRFLQLRDFELSKDNDELSKDIKRKTQKLNDNGVSIESLNNISETPTHSNNDNNKNKEEEKEHNKIYHPKIKQIYLKSKKSLHSNINNNYTKPLMSSPTRQILKPKINNLEFWKQIQKLQKIKPQRKKYKSNNNIVNINSSFRETFSKKEKTNITNTHSLLIESKVKESDKNENEFLFTSKHNIRSPKKIQAAIRSKRKKELCNEKDKIHQNNKRILNIFKQLFNLDTIKQVPRTTKHKHIKTRQNEYLFSNTNISTIIDEEKLKAEVFKVQGILYQDNNNNEILNTQQHNKDKNNNNTNSLEQSLKYKNSINTNIKPRFKKEHSPVNKLKEENIKTTSEGLITKEANIPSLSHSFNTNTNPNNNKIEIKIEPRCVLNLVIIIKIFYRRRIFYDLYKQIYPEIIYERYYIAFSWLILILKQDALYAIKKYSFYIQCHDTLRALLAPFLRHHLEFFLNQCQYKKKLIYLIEFLTKRLKKSCLQFIIFYGHYKVSRKNVFIAICETLAKICLIKAFKIFVHNINNDLNTNESNYNDYFLERSGSDSYQQMYTYLFESISSESYSINPNSEKSPKLHELFRRVEIEARERGDYFDGEIDLSMLKQKAKERLWKNASKSINNNNDSVVSNNNNILVDSIESRSNENENEKILVDDDNKGIKIEEHNECICEEDSPSRIPSNLEQDISIDNEHSNIEWVINLPTDSKNKSEVPSKTINKKPKLEIIPEPPKETLLPFIPQVNNGHNRNNSNDNKQLFEQKSDLIKEEIIFEDISLILNTIKSKNKDNNLIQNDSKQIKPQTENIPNTSDANIKQNNCSNEKNIFSNINTENFVEALTNELIDKLIVQEIQNKKLIPHKHFHLVINPNNNLQLSQSGSFTSSSLNNLTNSQENKDTHPKNTSFFNSALLNTANENLLIENSASSVFNKTIKDKKNEQSIHIYNQQIAPKLISLIKQEIINNYNDIFTNISTPLKVNQKELIVSLSLLNNEIPINDYKVSQTNKEITDILDKKTILSKFAPINKEIRLDTSSKFRASSKPNNNINELEYPEQLNDDLLNNCLIDAAVELINKERKYGEEGEPLPWSNRTRNIIFKYDKHNPNKLANYIETQLTQLMHDKMGLIKDNYNYLTKEQVNYERERKLLETAKNELKESQTHWSNLEIQETQIKLEVSDLLLDQLFVEVIEILEHTYLSRQLPELYQYKSIYACEEIPRLSVHERDDENDDYV